MKNIKIGICGWGNVATGLFSALNTNKDILEKNSGASFSIKVIGARRDNPKCDPGNTRIERDIFEVVNHDVDVLVELIGGVETARELILHAIRNKKHVITANKAVIYSHGNEIFAEAKKYGVHILFESAVCAGTPIIKLFKEELAGNNISKISGMLNGTSNFILSKMEDGGDFEPTLKNAQEEGYAEPDPTFDIEGTDAAHKIGILASLAYGLSLPPKNFHIEGITKIEKNDFRYAAELGYTIKHLAVAKLNDDNLELRAHPALLDLNSHLANLKGVRNGIEVDTDLIGKIHIAGSGAGQESTASGLISDLVYLSNSLENMQKLNESNKNDQIPILEFTDLIFQYYFYIEAEDIPGVMASISSLMAKNNIGIDSIIQKDKLDKNHVPIILVTNPFQEKEHEALLNELSQIESIKIVRSIRIEK